MVILLHINKITFDKSENVEKETHISQNLAKIILEDTVFENLEKNPGKLHYQTLVTLVVTQ